MIVIDSFTWSAFILMSGYNTGLVNHAVSDTPRKQQKRWKSDPLHHLHDICTYLVINSHTQPVRPLKKINSISVFISVAPLSESAIAELLFWSWHHHAKIVMIRISQHKINFSWSAFSTHSSVSGIRKVLISIQIESSAWAFLPKFQIRRSLRPSAGERNFLSVSLGASLKKMLVSLEEFAMQDNWGGEKSLRFVGLSAKMSRLLRSASVMPECPLARGNSRFPKRNLN